MPEVIVDTRKLRTYADRLSRVNRRIRKLDERLDKLYLEVGLRDLFNLIQADSLTGYNWRIVKCQDYMTKTATSFEQVERELSSMNPLSFNPRTAAVSLPIFNPNITVNKRYKTTEKYFSIFSEYVSGKIDGYIERIKNCVTNEDVIVEWYTWFKDDLYSDFDTMKGMIEDIAEEMTFHKPDLLPEKVDEFFETLDDCDVLIDVTTSLRDWYNTGDGWQAYQDIGFTVFSTIVKKGNKWLDGKNNLKYLETGASGFIRAINSINCLYSSSIFSLSAVSSAICSFL